MFFNFGYFWIYIYVISMLYKWLRKRVKKWLRKRDYFGKSV